MPVYNSNILPAYASTLWEKHNAVFNEELGSLIISNSGHAVFKYAVTDFSAQGYILFSCSQCTGNAFISLHYQDTSDNIWRIHTVPIVPTGISLPIVLNEAITQELYFYVYASGEATVGPVTAQLIEQAIRSVDLEYASGTSRTVPPEDGWQTDPPKWQSDRYIWQRTATTFVDGHTEYSDPVCIQDSNAAGIYEIIEEYYLSTSETEVINGEWSTTQPTWESKKYIWTRSKITLTDTSVSYTDPVLAQALNQANEHAQNAEEAVDSLDKELNQQGVFDRLTNSGKAQGLYLDQGDVYINASYIRSGRLEVLSGNNYLFYADKDTEKVFIAGFSVANNSLYTGATTTLASIGLGVYVGIDGITAGAGGIHATMSDGLIYGGPYDGAQTGYISFSRVLGETDRYGLTLAGESFVCLAAPEVAVSDYTAPDDTSMMYMGGSGTYNNGFAHLADFLNHGVPYNMEVVGSYSPYLYYDLYVPTGSYLTFTKGLLTSIPS